MRAVRAVNSGEGAIGEGFGAQLDGVMASVREAGRKGVWMRVPIEQACAIPAAARLGFKYHHAEGDAAMLLNWLPTDASAKCPVPDFATHVVGMGGMCINERNEVRIHV